MKGKRKARNHDTSVNSEGILQLAVIDTDIAMKHLRTLLPRLQSNQRSPLLGGGAISDSSSSKPSVLHHHPRNTQPSPILPSNSPYLPISQKQQKNGQEGGTGAEVGGTLVTSLQRSVLTAKYPFYQQRPELFIRTTPRGGDLLHKKTKGAGTMSTESYQYAHQLSCGMCGASANERWSRKWGNFMETEIANRDIIERRETESWDGIVNLWRKLILKYFHAERRHNWMQWNFRQMEEEHSRERGNLENELLGTLAALRRCCFRTAKNVRTRRYGFYYDEDENIGRNEDVGTDPFVTEEEEVELKKEWQRKFELISSKKRNRLESEESMERYDEIVSCERVEWIRTFELQFRDKIEMITAAAKFNHLKKCRQEIAEIQQLCLQERQNLCDFGERLERNEIRAKMNEDYLERKKMALKKDLWEVEQKEALNRQKLEEFFHQDIIFTMTEIFPDYQEQGRGLRVEGRAEKYPMEVELWMDYFEKQLFTLPSSSCAAPVYPLNSVFIFFPLHSSPSGSSSYIQQTQAKKGKGGKAESTVVRKTFVLESEFISYQQHRERCVIVEEEQELWIALSAPLTANMLPQRTVDQVVEAALTTFAALSSMNEAENEKRKVIEKECQDEFEKRETLFRQEEALLMVRMSFSRHSLKTPSSATGLGDTGEIQDVDLSMLRDALQSRQSNDAESRPGTRNTIGSRLASRQRFPPPQRQQISPYDAASGTSVGIPTPLQEVEVEKPRQTSVVLRETAVLCLQTNLRHIAAAKVMKQRREAEASRASRKERELKEKKQNVVLCLQNSLRVSAAAKKAKERKQHTQRRRFRQSEEKKRDLLCRKESECFLSIIAEHQALCPEIENRRFSINFFLNLEIKFCSQECWQVGKILEDQQYQLAKLSLQQIAVKIEDLCLICKGKAISTIVSGRKFLISVDTIQALFRWRKQYRKIQMKKKSDVVILAYASPDCTTQNGPLLCETMLEMLSRRIAAQENEVIDRQIRKIDANVSSLSSSFKEELHHQNEQEDSTSSNPLQEKKFSPNSTIESSVAPISPSSTTNKAFVGRALNHTFYMCDSCRTVAKRMFQNFSDFTMNSRLGSRRNSQTKLLEK